MNWLKGFDDDEQKEIHKAIMLIPHLNESDATLPVNNIITIKVISKMASILDEIEKALLWCGDDIDWTPFLKEIFSRKITSDD